MILYYRLVNTFRRAIGSEYNKCKCARNGLKPSQLSEKHGLGRGPAVLASFLFNYWLRELDSLNNAKLKYKLSNCTKKYGVGIIVPYKQFNCKHLLCPWCTSLLTLHAIKLFDKLKPTSVLEVTVNGNEKHKAPKGTLFSVSNPVYFAKRGYLVHRAYFTTSEANTPCTREAGHSLIYKILLDHKFSRLPDNLDKYLTSSKGIHRVQSFRVTGKQG